MPDQAECNTKLRENLIEQGSQLDFKNDKNKQNNEAIPDINSAKFIDYKNTQIYKVYFNPVCKREERKSLRSRSSIRNQVFSRHQSSRSSVANTDQSNFNCTQKINYINPMT